MIEIDGRRGGGQMLRTALTLSAIKGKPFRMENIRGSRKNPGLKRQHIEAVKTVARLCNADIEGLEQGSETLTFRPGKLEPRNFTVNIGTAGSINLVLDTVMPITTQFTQDFRLDVGGGTDVKWSPSSPYMQNVKLPLLKQNGFKGEIGYQKHGFYPKGGGKARHTTQEFSMNSIDLMRRGALERLHIFSTASGGLKEQKVADRQAKELERRIKSQKPSVEVGKDIEYVESDSPGSVLCLKAEYAGAIAGFDIYGEKGVRSEKLAEKVFEDFQVFEGSDGAVDSFMGDQLLIYLAIVGGRMSVPDFTPHMETNIETIRRFGIEIEWFEREKDVVVES